MKKLIAAIVIIFASNLAFADPTPSPTPQPDKLKDVLAEMLVGVTQTAAQAKEFVVAQLPDVVRQLLWWKFAESLVPMLFWLVVAALFFKYAYNRFNADDFKD